MFSKVNVLIYRLLTLCFTSVILCFVIFCFNLKKAQASEYNSSDIKFTLTINDNTANGNLVRVAKDKPALIKASLKLTSPDKLVVGTDSVSLRYGITIRGINVGVVSVAQKDQKCSRLGGMNIPGFSTWNDSVTCEYPYKGNPVSRTVQKGETLDFTITLSPEFRNSNGVNTASDSGTLNKIYVYPFFETLNPSGVSFAFNNVTFDLAKEVTLQVYNTDAQVLAAAGTPSPVDGNGSISTSPSSTSSKGLTGFINDLITGITQLIITLLYKVFYLLLMPLMLAILSIKTYSDSFVNVIYVGWQILRNVSNILFIIAMIVMGMATILRSSGYEYKHMLVELIIAALLVNFSLVIGQSILAVADTAQAQFLPAREQTMKALGLKLMPNDLMQKVNAAPFISDSFFASAITNIIFLTMAVAAFGVFAAITAFLIIRVVMLWLFLMVSPIAFVANILPATHHYSSEWWNGFIKYAAFTPMMAFFLNIAALVADKSSLVLQSISAPANDSILGSFALTVIYSLGGNLILIIFLYAALKFAEESGVMGAHAIVDVAQKGMFAPAKAYIGLPALAAKGAGKIGGTMLGNAYREKVQIPLARAVAKEGPGYSLKKMALAATNPGKTYKIFEDSQHKREHDAEHQIEAGLKMAYQKTWKKMEPLDEMTEATFHKGSEFTKMLDSVPGEKANLANLATFTKNLKKDQKMENRAIFLEQLRLLVRDGGLTSVLSEASKYGGKQNYSADDIGLTAYLNDLLDQGLVTDGEAGHMKPIIEDFAIKNKEYFYYSGYQIAHGHPHILKLKKDDKGKYIAKEEGVVGYEEYNGLRDTVRQRLFDSEDGQKKIADKIEKIKEEKGELTEDEMVRYRAMFAEEVKGELLNEEKKKMNPGQTANLENFEAYVEGVHTRATIYDRTGSQPDAREGKPSRFSAQEPGGERYLNDIGVHLMARFSPGRGNQAGEWNQNSQMATLQAMYSQKGSKENILKVKKHLEDDLNLDDGQSAVRAAIQMRLGKRVFIEQNAMFAKKENLDKIYKEVDRLTYELSASENGGKVLTDSDFSKIEEKIREHMTSGELKQLIQPEDIDEIIKESKKLLPKK